jgi:hypothetical protein
MTPAEAFTLSEAQTEIHYAEAILEKVRIGELS